MDAKQTRTSNNSTPSTPTGKDTAAIVTGCEASGGGNPGAPASSVVCSEAPQTSKTTEDLMREAAASGKVLSVGEMLMAWAPPEFVFKMYIVVNGDLNMGKGKLCAQTGHAIAAWMRRLIPKPTEAYNKWVAGCEPKIVLKASEAVVRKLHESYPNDSILVVDAGKTQVAPGSVTALAFQPMHVQNQPRELKTLKLL